MKKKIIGILVIPLLIGTIVSQVSACTGFTYDDEDNVFACHNEDPGLINFNLRFFPPEDDKHGRVFFEFGVVQPDGRTVMMPWGAMNDQGYWWSSLSTPYLKPLNSTDKPDFNNPDCYYKDHIGEYCIAECSTVVEAIDIAKDYNHNSMSTYQVFNADKTGNSAINEGDDIIYKEGNFQVVSNFLQSHPELGDEANGFERYDTAVSMLEEMTQPSVEYFRDICNATHLAGTVYSIICDLENQIIYIYYLHDFEKQVVIDLNEELQKGEHHIYLGSLFEPDANQPPAKPEPPKGDESGLPGEDIEYRVTKTNDPERDKISYMFDWGDGTQSPWLYKTMGTIKSPHNWTERRTYNVRVKARDQYGAESEWSDPLIVTIPKTKPFINRPLQIFLQQYPRLFSIIRQLLRL
jgi:hypothetical protein